MCSILMDATSKTTDGEFLWASPGIIGQLAPNIGVFTDVVLNQSYTNVAYTGSVMTLSAVSFKSGLLKILNLTSGVTFNLDTAINFINVFGNQVGNMYSGCIVYTSTAGPRSLTFLAGTGVTLYTITTGSNAYFKHWKLLITSSTTIDFYLL